MHTHIPESLLRIEILQTKNGVSFYLCFERSRAAQVPLNHALTSEHYLYLHLSVNCLIDV